ncbi:MAG: zinc-ribbon domain-containing protein [Bacteroidales bacterium]|nr:zinc-ribbon domain-containing protein [Bacteroidales bacterium]
MSFCIHCGTPLPEGAKFCPACGKRVATTSARTSPDGRGIIIDAPAGATVSISGGPEKTSTVDAPELKGEFTLSEWDGPTADSRQGPQAAAVPAKRQDGRKEKKKRPFILRFFRFIFGLILTAIILLVLYWFYQGYTSA